MATNACIIVKNNSNTFDCVICHYDGYFENTGHALFNHFNSYQKAFQLVHGGDDKAGYIRAISSSGDVEYNGSDNSSVSTFENMTQVVDAFKWVDNFYLYDIKKGWLWNGMAIDKLMAK